MTSPRGPASTKNWQSWGRVERAEHDLISATFSSDVEAAFALIDDGDSALAVGQGRSYGTSCLNPDQLLIDMKGLSRLMSFDETTGVLRAQCGISLWEIIAFALPKGYFLPTTPGSQFITLGGAIANDVHGKNHHLAGTLGAHIERIALFRSDQGTVEISLAENADLFRATIGGLGLTGVMLWADLKLVKIPSGQLTQTVSRFAHLDGFFETNSEALETSEHTVAWIDCLAGGAALGRGVYTSANWSDAGDYDVQAADKGLNVPVSLPSWILNGLSIKAFNALYYRTQAWKVGTSEVDYASYFYPLDSIRNWNRLYGRKGFFQYQSVIPDADAREATRDMLQVILKAGMGSFLAVLKTFGDKPSPGMLSFPMTGVTLALDFPNRGDKTLNLMADLDHIIAEAGGRLYPAKDGRISRDMMESGYPLFSEFTAHIDAALSSLFYRKLELP